METMRALVKKEARPGLVARKGSRSHHRHQRCADQGAADRNLRNRCAYLRVGCLGPEDDSRADGRGPRVRRPDRRRRLERQGLSRRRDRQRRGARGLRPLPQLPGRAPAPLQGHQGRRRQSSRRVRRVSVAAHDQRLGARSPDPRATSRRSSIPSATPCTRLSSSTCWAKTC